MNLYPALQAQMGVWKYYIVKMKMRELASEVGFATEIYDDRTLDNAIQRELRDGRVRKEIVSFLARRPDRFFASIVVAAIGGTPQFFPVQITEDPQFAIFASQGIDQSFGVLTFKGDQKYYALDGQHRLKAIKTLLDRSDPLSNDCPEGFGDEEISVLIVVKRDEPKEAFLKSYRRLFSSLNRYAKSTDMDTNIIMDEDDAFAIITRRLISEHEFFKWEGVKQRESPRVKMSGKNLKTTDSFFTSLQTLYEMNTDLLSASWRRNAGWGADKVEIRAFKRFRPEEDYLDGLYVELTMYWNGLLSVLPELREEPSTNRNHDTEESTAGLRDHLLFWPIGQELFGRVARRLFDRRQSDTEVKNPTAKSIEKALQRLRVIPWELHGAPWRDLILVKRDENWRMRNEDRKEAIEVAERVLRWMVGLDDLPSVELEELQKNWAALLLPPQDEAYLKEAWKQLTAAREAACKIE